jgi:hypothetical protein
MRPTWTCERTETTISKCFEQLRQQVSSYYGYPRRYLLHLANIDEPAMLALCRWIHNIDCDHRLNRQFSDMHIYTNDLSFLPHLEQLQVSQPDLVYNLRTQQACASIPDGEVWMISPQHSLRTYLSLTSPVQNKDLLCDFLQQWGDELRMSPGLKAWFAHEGRLTSRSTYFVDHNHTTILTAVGIISPGIVGRTVAIRPKPS